MHLLISLLKGNVYVEAKGNLWLLYSSDVPAFQENLPNSERSVRVCIVLILGMKKPPLFDTVKAQWPTALGNKL